MNLTIERLNGTVYNLDELGIKTRDFIISSPSYRHRTEEAEGRPGLIDMGSVLEPRSIKGVFYTKAADFESYTTVRDEVFRLFRSDEAFYIIESRSPDKRWLVKVDSSYELDQQRTIGLFDVDFICYEGHSESVLSTIDPSVFAAQISGTGSRIIKYKHNTANFEIYNAGDIEINPRFMPIVIAYKGQSNKLSIENLTTNDKWSYTGTSNTDDIIRLDGIRSTKNSLSVFRETNKKLIRLTPGWNEFSIEGTTGSFEITFDFRFYYL